MNLDRIKLTFDLLYESIQDKKLITITPGGLQGFYVLGICTYIKENYDLSNYVFSGASAGSWNSLFLSYKYDTKKILDAIFDIDYEKAGAACLSVLTDQNFFHGKSEYLEKIKKIVDLPILRKDFIIDEFQIFESRFIGADCILLIVACLNDTELNDFYNISESLKMDALIEVHNEDELQRALKLKPKMIGINNRNLKNMTVTLDTSIKLVKKIPKNILVVSESGFKNHSDLKLMEQYGIKSFLIGETFMKSKNIQSSVENILFGRNNA